MVSPVTFTAKGDGRTRLVHADHLKKNLTNDEENDVIIPMGKKYLEEVLKLTTTSPNKSENLGQVPIKENTPAKDELSSPAGSNDNLKELEPSKTNEEFRHLQTESKALKKLNR